MLLLCAELAAGAGEPTARFALSQKQASVGRPVTATMELAWDPSRYDFLGIDDATAGTSWTVRWNQNVLPDPGVDSAELRGRFFAFVPGVHKVDGVTARFRSRSAIGDQPPVVVTAPAISLPVDLETKVTPSPQFQPERDLEIEEIAPTFNVPLPFWWEYRDEIGWGMTMFAAGALLALLGGRLFRRTPAPPIPPAERAMTRFDLLERELSGPFNTPDWHGHLADALRAYVSDRWLVPALRMTTFELDHAMRAVAADLATGTHASLVELLEEADMARFARVDSSVSECMARVARAREFVETTRPRLLETPDRQRLEAVPAS